MKKLLALLLLCFSLGANSAIVVADRVMETTTTTGTGSITLAGALVSYRTFGSVCSTNDTFRYAIAAVDAVGNPTGDWEVGNGTYSGTNTLARTTVEASSNSGSAVSFSAGTKRVWLDASAASIIRLSGAFIPTFTLTGTTAITLPTSGTVATTSNKLSAFAATTSSELAGVISDETGSGALVFGTSPALTTPDLGTPSALVGTNITGTAASLTAGHVTTNANLTGPITSSGNATSIAAQTGTGTTFVVDTSPTLVTPNIGAATGTSLSLTGGVITLPTVENALTAHAGGGQSSALALSATATYHRVSTVATAGDSVRLPTSVAGIAHFIQNVGAASMQVYGASTDTINGVATGTGVALGTGTGAWFICTAAGNWITPDGGRTGTGNVVRDTSPTLVTPTLGAATATTINGVSITGSGTVAVGTKTLTASNTLTLAGTDSTTITFQATDTYVGRATTDTLTNKTLTNPTVTNYVETAYVPSSGTSFTVSLANGTLQQLTTSGNVTITLPTPAAGKSYTIQVNYGGTHTVTWAGGGTIKWAGGAAPTATSVNGKFDVYVCFSVDATNTFCADGGRNF